MSDLKKFANKNDWSYVSKGDFAGLNNKINVIIVLLPKWSNKDIQLINSIKYKLNELADVIYVFDIDDFNLQDELDNYFPGLTSIIQTPAIAFYKKGVLINIVQGEEIEGLKGDAPLF